MTAIIAESPGGGKDMETVGDAMLHHPSVHPADLTVEEAREFFARSTKRHLVLLVRDDVLVGAVTRDDIAMTRAAPHIPAAAVASLVGRTVAPDVAVDPLRARMARTGLRRIAVVDAEMHLLGLLCLKASLKGFCTDEGVASWRAEPNA